MYGGHDRPFPGRCSCSRAGGWPPPAQAPDTARQRADMVVELYTSQGCSQCPRANRLLGTFARETGVLALTFPVGIWDYLGWRDTFARPEFSERQRAYSRRAARARALHAATGDQWRTPDQRLGLGRAPAPWSTSASAMPRARGNRRTVSITRLRNGRVRVTIGAGAARCERRCLAGRLRPGPARRCRSAAASTSTAPSPLQSGALDRSLGDLGRRGVWYERAHCTPECAVIVQTPTRRAHPSRPPTLARVH